MDFACEGFAVRVDHKGVDLFFVLQCANYRERTVGCGEGEIDEFQGVIDCHPGEASGWVDGGVHVADECVGEVGECVGVCADGDICWGVGGGVEIGEVRWGWSVV